MIIDSGTPAFTGNKKTFKLELSWFTCENFYNIVVEIWNKPVKECNLVQQWNNKMSAFRCHLWGWADQSVVYKQQKASLQNTVNDLDSTPEVRDFTNTDREQLA